MWFTWKAAAIPSEAFRFSSIYLFLLFLICIKTSFNYSILLFLLFLLLSFLSLRCFTAFFRCKTAVHLLFCRWRHTTFSYRSLYCKIAILTFFLLACVLFVTGLCMHYTLIKFDFSFLTRNVVYLRSSRNSLGAYV